MWAPETRSESWRSLITTSPSEMSFASIRAIVMRCRGCLRFRSCPIVGEDGQSIWLDGSPNPIHDVAAAESAVAWMAVSELAPQPVSFYAAVFFLVNATYILLIWELLDCSPVDDVPPKVRTIMRVRSTATLCLFGVAAVVALKFPLVGLGICVCCLVVYLKPEAPGGEARRAMWHCTRCSAPNASRPGAAIGPMRGIL